MSERVAPNRREVAAKIIDGEAVLINLTNGVYYSMDGAGAVVWALIEAHSTPQEIAEIVAREYGIDPQVADRDVRRLVDELVAERLVGRDGHAQRPRDEGSARLSEGQAYVAPTLHKYTDMGDVLALDPPLPRLTEDHSHADWDVDP